MIPALKSKSGQFTFLFKQMLPSSTAPEKHPYLVCPAYSEVTVSKNSFLKIFSGLGSTQVGCGARSTLLSCLGSTLQAEGGTMPRASKGVLSGTGSVPWGANRPFFLVLEKAEG